MNARRLQARRLLVASLSHAMATSGATQRSVAELAEVKPITVHRWLAGETPINVEAVLSSPGLRTAFREYLCTHDHGTAGAPSFARKGKRK